jgi:hypothetical protein
VNRKKAARMMRESGPAGPPKLWLGRYLYMLVHTLALAPEEVAVVPADQGWQLG